MHRLGRAALTGLVLWLGSSALPTTPVRAQAPGNAGVEITPARVEADQTTRTISTDFTLFNHDAVPHVINLAVTGLSHDLDGTPQFSTPPDARARLQLSQSDITIPGNGQAAFHLAGRIPSGVGGVYAGVTATIRETEEVKPGVEVERRVAALVLLRGPKPWKETLAVDSLVFEAPAAKGGAGSIVAAVHNTGDVHQRPVGDVRVVGPQGVVATVALKPDLILPGWARRLRGSWTPPPETTDLDQYRLETSIGGTPLSVPMKVTAAPTTPTTTPAAGPKAGVKTGDGPGDLGAAVGASFFLLLLVAIFLFFLLWRRRRKKEEDEEENDAGSDETEGPAGTT